MKEKFLEIINLIQDCGAVEDNQLVFKSNSNEALAELIVQNNGVILPARIGQEVWGIFTPCGGCKDADGDEEAAEVLKIGITYGGAQLLALKCDGGIYFIKGKYLSPFKEDVELWKRRTGPIKYFVITTGMLTAGIVLPELEFRPQLAGELRDLVNML